MRIATCLSLFLALAACSGLSTERYLCARLPDITARYGDQSVTLSRSDAPDVELPRVAPNTFRQGSTSWRVSGNRAFLSENGATYLCRPY